MTNNVVTGTRSNDFLWGTTGNDDVQGMGGNDRFLEGLGDDIYDGGAGDDAIILFGARSDYEFAANQDGSFTVKKLSTQDVDLLINVEKVEFWSDNSTVDITELVPDLPQTPAAPVVPLTPVVEVERPVIDNVVNGTQSNDFLWGTTGNDEFLAGAGNDTILQGLGDDIFDGGAGKDQLALFGKQSDYLVTDNSDGSYFVTHLATDDVDLLIDVEEIAFWGDGTVEDIDDLV